MPNLKVASLFSGIGGIDLGFLQAGFDIVFANEIDKYACKTYKKNFPNNYLLEGDIKRVNPNDIPDFDVLVAGFPCQAFSIAGKQRGFEDKRGSLFFEIERVVEKKKPKVIFLENVKNLQEHDDGKTFNKIFASLAQFGYSVRYKILCPTEYANIPQRRERIFIVAFLDENLGELFKFPEPQELKVKLQDIIDFSIKHDDVYYINEQNEDYFLLKTKIKDKSQMYQLHFGQVRKGKDGICRTLTASMGGLKLHKPIIYDNFGIRYLTPQECLLLQGFPATFSFASGTTLDKAYSQAGNTVCVPLIKRIAINIKETLNKGENVMNKELMMQTIFEKLQKGLPSAWDGKASIEYMKEKGDRNWRQMEWPGFYFQFMCEKILGENDFMECPGKKYGKVEFDGFKYINWDFKAHSIDPAKKDGGKIPTNGYDETMQAINEYGQVCFIVASGESSYDTTGAFKTWHDELKGGISKYEEDRIERNAKSRRRKISFSFDELVFVWVNAENIQHCGKFQSDFRNSNGKARKAKVMININNPNLEIYKFKINK